MSVAARVADTMRGAMKSQTVTVAALAGAVERLTGRPYHHQYASRRLTSDRPLITISADLAPLARALGLDPVQLVADAYRAHLAGQHDTVATPGGRTTSTTDHQKGS